MSERRPVRPRDPAQLAKLIIDIATGEVADEAVVEKKITAVRRKAGQAGARARAQVLTSEQREDIARLAARARWKK